MSRSLRERVSKLEEAYPKPDSGGDDPLHEYVWSEEFFIQLGRTSLAAVTGIERLGILSHMGAFAAFKAQEVAGARVS